MLVNKCDRCGAEYESKGKEYRYMLCKGYSSFLQVDVDLCDECKEEFVKLAGFWMAQPTIKRKAGEMEDADNR